MSPRRLLAAAVAAAAAAGAHAQDLRPGQPPMAGAAALRTGVPATLAAPVAADPARAATAGFAAAYARARTPRLVVFWNRELTDEVDTERESYVHVAGETHATAATSRVAYATPWAAHEDGGSRFDATGEGEVRAGVRRIDRGRRDAPDAEAIDFDVERGFTQAFEGAGARLVDRTAIVRAGALGGDAGNVQAVETRAVLGRAELTLEVVPMDDPREASGVSYRIRVRDVRSGRVVASLASTGRAPAGRQPYVAGEHGFVRATPPVPTPYARGRQMAYDTMAALASRL